MSRVCIWWLNNSFCWQSCASWPGIEYLFNRRLLTRHVSSVYLHLFIVRVMLSELLHTTPISLSLYNSFTWAVPFLSDTHILMRHMHVHIQASHPTNKQNPPKKTACFVTASGFSYATDPFCTSFLGCEGFKAYCSPPGKGVEVSSLLNTIEKYFHVHVLMLVFN